MGYNAWQALGDMATTSGSYYSVLAQEQLRGKRLAEARESEESRYQRDKADSKAKLTESRAYQATEDERKLKESKETAVWKSEQNIEQAINLKEAEGIYDKNNPTHKQLIKGKDEKGDLVYYKQDSNGNLEPTNVQPDDRVKTLRETEGAKKASGYLYRMADATKSIHALVNDESFDMATGFKQLALVADINAIKDPKLKRYATAMSDWLRSKLRKESGAVIGDKEAMDEASLYFPRVTDDPAAIAEKRRRRVVAEMSIYREVRGTRATEDDFLEEIGDPWGTLKRKPRESDTVKDTPPKVARPADIQKILDAQAARKGAPSSILDNLEQNKIR